MRPTPRSFPHPLGCPCEACWWNIPGYGYGAPQEPCFWVAFWRALKTLWRWPR